MTESLMAAAYDTEELIRALILKSQRAREDIHEMFNFVMRDEHTQAPIREAPHQRLIIDFVMAHQRCCVEMPIGTAKTYTACALTLAFLGEDPSTRGAVISCTETQAKKPVHMVRDYIEKSNELRLVYPNLVKGSPWLDDAITVRRPPGIRDPSLAAYGYGGGSIIGSRLNWIIMDDLLNAENTNTNDQRVKMLSWIFNSVLSRLDPTSESRAVFFNTPWHPKDAINVLRDGGEGFERWPCIRVDVEGDIEITGTDWDSDLIRPKAPNDPICRLVAHDDEAYDEHRQQGNVPLWPERYNRTYIDMKRRTTLPKVYNQTMMCLTRDDGTSQCKQEWIDKCKLLGRGLTLTTARQPYPTFTGLDLAVGKGEENDDTVFFTFCILPTKRRRLLNVEIGKFDGPSIVKKIQWHVKAYDSVVRVENNGCQEFVRQFALDADAALAITAHTTGRAKADPTYGVQSLFIELSNGAWEIPCDRNGVVHPNVQRWIDGCLYYIPGAHTDDALMACYFGREQARAFGYATAGELAGEMAPTNGTSQLASLFNR